MELFVGTYEGFLLGNKITSQVTERGKKSTLSRYFTDDSHRSTIRCLAVHDRWLATGGDDDRIFIYDMREQKQKQILLWHEATITVLQFTPDGAYLLSGSFDGKMVATAVSNWSVAASWERSHKHSAITHIACHPSSKMALTLAEDMILRTWNLVKGRVAYKTNLRSRGHLKAPLDCLTMSPNGIYFTICDSRSVEIWSIKTANVLQKVETEAKPISVCWIGEYDCLVGMEDSKINWLRIEETTEVVDAKEMVSGHSGRVKSMDALDDYLVTASSLGDIKLWKLLREKRKLKEMAVSLIGCRPTCLKLLDCSQFPREDDMVSDESRLPIALDRQKLAPKDVPQIDPKPMARGFVVVIEEESETTTTGKRRSDSNSKEEMVRKRSRLEQTTEKSVSNELKHNKQPLNINEKKLKVSRKNITSTKVSENNDDGVSKRKPSKKIKSTNIKVLKKLPGGTKTKRKMKNVSTIN